MATHTGSEGTVKIGSDTLGEIRSYTIESTGETIEDSTMGDAARTYKAGLTTFDALLVKAIGPLMRLCLL